MNTSNFFSDERRHSLMSKCFEECQKIFADYVAFVKDESNSSYFGWIKQAVIQTKFDGTTLCILQFVADCSAPLDAPPTVVRHLSQEDTPIIYITMGNNVWDHFAPHSHLWMNRFTHAFQERFHTLCQEEGWKGTCSKTSHGLQTGALCISCSIRFTEVG